MVVILTGGWWNRVGLTRHSQYTFPSPTTGIHVAGRCGHKLGNGQKDHAIVAKADGESSVARHGTMYGVLSKLHTVETVGGVGRNRTNHVGWINVPVYTSRAKEISCHAKTRNSNTSSVTLT